MKKPLLKSNKDKRWTVRPKALPVPYSLLLKLKKAGFPQDLEGRSLNGVFVPTCDDLFEALGDKIWTLTRYHRPTKPPIWRATALWLAKTVEGKTPLEALIRLAIKV